MIIRRPLFSPKTCRALFGWGVIVALVFHGLIPLGYMPDFARKADQFLPMRICGGMDMSSMAMDDNATHKSSDKNDNDGKTQNHPPCPFSVNAVFAFGNFVPDAVAPVYLLVAIAAFAAFSFFQQYRFGNSAPRAPPLSI